MSGQRTKETTKERQKLRNEDRKEIKYNVGDVRMEEGGKIKGRIYVVYDLLFFSSMIASLEK